MIDLLKTVMIKRIAVSHLMMKFWINKTYLTYLNIFIHQIDSKNNDLDSKNNDFRTPLH